MGIADPFHRVHAYQRTNRLSLATGLAKSWLSAAQASSCAETMRCCEHLSTFRSHYLCRHAGHPTLPASCRQLVSPTTFRAWDLSGLSQLYACNQAPIFCNLPQPSLGPSFHSLSIHVVINQSPLTKRIPNFIAVRQTHTRILVCWRSWDQWCYRLLFRSTICGGTSSRLVSQSTFDQSSSWDMLQDTCRLEPSAAINI